MALRNEQNIAKRLEEKITLPQAGLKGLALVGNMLWQVLLEHAFSCEEAFDPWCGGRATPASNM